MTLLTSKRGRIQIIGDILQFVYNAGGSGILRSHICDLLHTSYNHLNTFVPDLLRANLLRTDGKLYFITIEGEDFLKVYRPLINRIKYIDSMLLMQPSMEDKFISYKRS